MGRARARKGNGEVGWRGCLGVERGKGGWCTSSMRSPCSTRIVPTAFILRDLGRPPYSCRAASTVWARLEPPPPRRAHAEKHSPLSPLLHPPALGPGGSRRARSMETAAAGEKARALETEPMAPDARPVIPPRHHHSQRRQAVAAVPTVAARVRLRQWATPPSTMEARASVVLVARRAGCPTASMVSTASLVSILRSALFDALGII